MKTEMEIDCRRCAAGVGQRCICDCSCHTDTDVMHFSPCCDLNGMFEFHEERRYDANPEGYRVYLHAFVRPEIAEQRINELKGVPQ